MKLTSIVLALAAGLVIAGCGDDDEEEPQTVTSGATGASGGSEEDFVAAADAICTEASAALAAEASEQYPEGPPTGAAADTFVEDVVIPNFQEQHDAITELTPPEGEEEAVEDLLLKLQAAIDEIEADPGAFIEGGGASAAIDEATQAAQDLGITACGE